MDPMEIPYLTYTPNILGATIQTGDYRVGNSTPHTTKWARTRGPIGIITPINGLVNGYLCLFHPYKWKYKPTYNCFLGPMTHLVGIHKITICNRKLTQTKHTFLGSAWVSAGVDHSLKVCKRSDTLDPPSISMDPRGDSLDRSSSRNQTRSKKCQQRKWVRTIFRYIYIIIYIP